MKVLRAFWVLPAFGILSQAGDLRGAGNWLKLANSAPDSVAHMLLLPDGTVMAQNDPTSTEDDIGNDWYQLTPDNNGHYVNGTWGRIASMHDSRRAYASVVLTNGTVFVAGAEYGSGGPTAEIYYPLLNLWTYVNPPTSLLNPGAGQSFVDAQSDVLPNGKVLVRPAKGQYANETLLYDAVSNVWSQGPYANLKLGEESWVKLPDGSILLVDPVYTSSAGISSNGFGTNTERYIPSLNQWIPDKPVPVALYTPLSGYVGETGPAFLLPNGNAFFLGGTGHTAIYTPSGATNAGSWVAGPDIPGGLVSADAPAAMMPNGKILCAVSGGPSITGTNAPAWPTPTSFYEYDYANGPIGTFTQVNGPTGLTDDIYSYQSSMLVLPDGSVLYCHYEENNLFYSSFGSQLYVYVPIGAQVASGAPVITSITPNADGSFHLVGQGLTGLSEGAAFGDDAQMACNYPLVMFTDTNNGHLDYARTYNWSSTGVHTGSTPVSTEFTLPPGLIPQNYLVSVSAAGVTSAPVLFSFVVPSSLSLCPGDSGSLSITTNPMPATYQWYQNGNPLSGQTTSTLSIMNAASNQSGLYTLKVTSGGASVVSAAVPVSVGVWDISQPPASNSAVLCQPKTLTVTARGKGTVSGQWYHNGDLVVTNSRVTETSSVQNGATTFTLSFANVEYQDDATYNMVLRDDCGLDVEPPFTMRVTPNPPWVTVATNGPQSRYWASMAYDSDRQVTVLFGGSILTNTGTPVLNDTWEWDGTNWNQRFPATSPAPRSQAQMVYDSRRHRSVLFGGQVYTNGQYHIILETWEWDGTNWQRIITPNVPAWTQPDLFASCYDWARGETLIYGGNTSTGRVYQLWGYNGTNWTQKTPAAPTPVAPSPLMTFDSHRNLVVLLGGAPQAGTSPYAAGAVWEWDGSAWHERPQSGQVFGGASAQDVLAFDSFRNESVLYGAIFGIVDGSIPGPPTYPFPDNDRFIWRWNGQQWQADPPTPTPGAGNLQLDANMVFDSHRNGILLFGGIDNGNGKVTNNTYEILYADDPAILKQPTVQVSFLGQQVQLSVLAAGAPPISYQWEKGGVPLSDTGNITGTSTNTLTIHSTGATDTGVYQVVLNNLCGMTTSQPISLTVSAGQLAIGISGGQIVVTWNNPSASLQTAPEVTGPWTTLVGATSPYPVNPPANRAFFRLIQ